MKPPVIVLPTRLAICSLAPDAAVPPWAAAGALSCVCRTSDELSIVCADEGVPPGVRAERGWRALKADGPLDFDLTGVLLELAAPLARAGVSIFAISTFDTDYVLVKDTDVDAAVAALRDAGIPVHR